MGKKSELHELMVSRMNGVMNGITNNDREYQEIIRKSKYYSNKLGLLNLLREPRLLIDHYVSEQNALESRYGMLAYLLGLSDCREILLERDPFTETFQRVPRILGIL